VASQSRLQFTWVVGAFFAIAPRTAALLSGASAVPAEASSCVHSGQRFPVYYLASNHQTFGHPTFVLWRKDNHSDYVYFTPSLH
jgi:hypothetical protein